MTAAAPAGVLEHIDPQSLDVATNVRTEAEATLDKEFLDSIRANGVIVPIVASRDDKGVHVRYGQRRTLAAQQVGLVTVPVYVVDVDQADDAQSVVATLLAAGGYDLGHSIGHGNSQAHEFLGIERSHGEKLAEYLTAHPTRAAHVAVAIVLGGIEQQTSRETWRYPRPEKAAYFKALNAWGYPLSPVEQIAAMVDAERK